ncbi:ABC transporter permease [Liquorilactobacillus oeni]|uniref:ABC superfamily ATP binding cassette transporter, membrane protein n=1 Tax=Liquorilactobacillus oeni DSM 19972 TaxID=1423777 RepID=A0A0R1MBY1_9LACO|nr:ABC transporter permease [Liquorilactobacillus oeni]KRL05614.1 ABC superfamily ATP binding cassette transporter, membrane protein [Liquorilactobacillus oeni DSM 19972]
MNFVKRAFLNVKVKMGRSLLLFLVMSAILLFVLAGIIIQQAANSAVSSAKKSANATVTLAASREQAFKKVSRQSGTRPKLTLPSVSIATAKKIASSGYVKSYNISNSASVNASSFSAIETSSSSQQGPQGAGAQEQQSGDITLSGVSNTAQLTTFSSGGSKIVEGRGIKASDADTNNVTVEKQLAKENNLKVGSTISIKNTSKKVTKLKIIGIYKASSTENSGFGMMQNDPSNTIYSSVEKVNSIKGTSGKATSVTFTMNNPANAKKFIKSAKKQLSSSKFALTADDSTYRSILTPLNNVSSFANKIVWLVGIAGTIILALIVILMVRERRYEIGVLLSLGEKRWKVIAQFFSELLLIMAVSSIVALIGGKFLGNTVSNQLIQQTTSATSSLTVGSNQNQGPQAGGSGLSQGQANVGNANRKGIGQNKQLQSLDVNISLAAFLKLLGFGLFIILLATLLGTINVLLLEPRRILIS